MASFLDLIGLKRYDAKIKSYISTNGGKIDKIQVKPDTASEYTDVTMDGKTAKIDLSAYFKASNFTTEQIMQLIKDSVATVNANGLMSATDKQALNTIVEFFGTTADDNTVVDKITEVLAIFNEYPEGVDIITKLAEKANASDVYNKTEINTYLKGKASSITLTDWQGTKHVNNVNTGDVEITADELKTAIGVASATNGGYMSTTQVEKLSGIATGATADSAISTTEIDALFA